MLLFLLAKHNATKIHILNEDSLNAFGRYNVMYEHNKEKGTSYYYGLC